MRRYRGTFSEKSFDELKKDIIKLHDLLELREEGEVTYDNIHDDLLDALHGIQYEATIIKARMEEAYSNDEDLDWNTHLQDNE